MAGTTGSKAGTLQRVDGHIDDASSLVFACLYAYEGTIQALDRFQRNVTQYGIPLALYMGRSTTYHSPAQPTMEEQLARGETQELILAGDCGN